MHKTRSLHPRFSPFLAPFLKCNRIPPATLATPWSGTQWREATSGGARLCLWPSPIPLSCVQHANSYHVWRLLAGIVLHTGACTI